MIAASVWSLLIPAIEMSDGEGIEQLLPVLGGFLVGIALMWALDSLVPHMHVGEDEPEGRPSQLRQSTMLMFAVTMHNIPEGAACGALVAGALSQHADVTIAGAMALSIGIALQNFPEGAVISLPLLGDGMSKPKAFCMGMLSGVVEPIAAVLTVMFAFFVTPILPQLMAFAAGAMVYVVVEELIPEASQGTHSNLATLAFAVGFALMMTLDVVLG